MHARRTAGVLGGTCLFILGSWPAQAGPTTGCSHVVDGTFTSTGEWATCPTAQLSAFAPVNGVGGAVLGVDQGVPGRDNNLYLIYDDVGTTTQAAYLDVFFEVVPDGHAYLVRITSAGFYAFERPLQNTAPLDANGSFDLSAGSGWDPLSQEDLALANFHTALTFGSSPFRNTAHPIAELSLTIDRSGTGGPGGVYSEDPAFWSASETGIGTPDPPISSEIFTLSSDGSTVATKVLDANGNPLMQGSVLPEPGTVWLGGTVLIGMAAMGRRRGFRSSPSVTPRCG